MRISYVAHLSELDLHALAQALYFGTILSVWALCMAGTYRQFRHKK